MPVAAGTRLGPYEILAPVGAGGMGEVYKARDTRLDRVVAIKILRENFSERFEREARAVAALNHSHICALYDLGPNYLVMEFVEGEPLRGPVPLEKALDYAGQILEALDHAHRRGITHRDLKPGNILVTRQGVKLLDFGLAKIKPLPRASGETPTRVLTEPLTEDGQIVGTLHYISPEQLQGREADSRSDLFSFGCVLYEILTGKRAFTGQSAASVIAAIMDRPAPSVGDVAPPSLDRVLKRCLEKDPEARWQNALDLKLALELSVSAEGDPPFSDQPHERQSWLGGRWYGIAGWVAAGILAIAGLALTFTHLGAKQPQAPVVRFSILAPQTTGYGQAAISPDGTRIVFAARDAQGSPSLWIRDLNSEIPRQIPGTEGAIFAFWSPDQRYIAFNAGPLIKRVALSTGLIETVCETPDAEGGAWTPDGNIIFGRNLDSLYVVPAAGGAAKPFTSLDASRKETRHYWPSITPDGKYIVFTVISSLPEVQGIWIAPLSNPVARRRVAADISLAAYAQGHLLFVRNENLVALPYDLDSGKIGGDAVAIVNHVPFIPTAGFADFSVSSNGVLAIGAYEKPPKLAVFDRAGKVLNEFGGNLQQYFFLTISPDEKHVAADAPDAKGYQIFVFDPARDSTAQLTTGSNTGNFPVWSPDGSRIAFGSDRDGVYNIYMKASSGASEDEVVLQNSRNKFVMDWSPDGRYLLYGENPERSKRVSDLWVLPMRGERKPVPYVQDGLDKRDGQFSPDGRWVAYKASEGARPEIFVRAFPSGTDKLQISTDGGTRPRWRDDGKELFYMDASGRLIAVDIRVEGNRLSAGVPKPLFETGLPDALGTFDVYKGGQRFALPHRLPSDVQPLSVILNWPGLLRK